MTLRGTMGLTFLLAANAASAGQFDPIDVSSEAQHPTFILDRCHDLSIAVTTYAEALSSSPTYGKDSTRKAPYLWAADMSAEIEAVRAELPRTHASTVQDYARAFGPVVVPSDLPNLALYQSDMATCLKLFGPADE